MGPNAKRISQRKLIILLNTEWTLKIYKYFKNFAKWLIFAKFGHTGGESHMKYQIKSNFTLKLRCSYHVTMMTSPILASFCPL